MTTTNITAIITQLVRIHLKLLTVGTHTHTTDTSQCSTSKLYNDAIMTSS